MDVLDRLGAIQLDSVNAVARSQELVPAARLGPCSLTEMLREIYAQRLGFEYWGHAASWLPMAEYRYFLPRMAYYRERHRDYREEHAVLLGEILARIRDEDRSAPPRSRTRVRAGHVVGLEAGQAGP